MADIITLKDWNRGIAASPHVGLAELRNVEVDNKSGVARINMAAVKESASVVENTPYWIIGNPSISSELWALDSSQVVYKSTDLGDTWTKITGNGSGNGQGAIVWKDALFVFRNSTIDVYYPLSSSPAWSGAGKGALSWQTIDADGTWHPAIVGQDDILYIGCGAYIASVQAIGTFDPQNSATYTFTQQALDLPSYYKIRTLSELGKNLMIGTWVGANIYEHKIADIFPWDRSSDSFQLPIRMSENGIQASITIGNVMYFFAGIEGVLYATDGTNVKELARLPISLVNTEGGGFTQVYPGGMIYHDGKIIFGVHCTSSASYSHVWSYDLTSGALKIENEISAGFSSGTRVSALFSAGREVYCIGWQDASSNEGIDRVINSERYTGYKALIRSEYFSIGTKSQPVPLNEIEYELANALASGQGIRLGYRLNLTDSFTTIFTSDFATDGAITNQNNTLGITVEGGVQFQIELTTGSSSTTTPELKQVHIR